MNPTPWEVVAQNLPEHARNPIHTDHGAQAAGFPRALVAGVTTYAYLTHPVAVAWGIDWVANGGGEVRFRRPVFDRDLVRCATSEIDGSLEVAAVTDEPEQPRAVLRAIRHGGPAPAMRPGAPLPAKSIRLEGEWAADYGTRAGDPLPLYTDHDVVHPAVWPALANHLVHTEVARGGWVHTRSIVRHHSVGRPGAIADVSGVVVRRFDAHGERAVLDVQIHVEGMLVASLEHEAIVALP